MYNKIHHYVYRITNKVNNMHYYGRRSSKIAPLLDLGIKYFSSSKDKAFIKDQKINSHNYEYVVIAVLDSVQEAIEMEVYLHQIYDVGVNPRFYNKVKQTSTKFDFSGNCHTDNTKKRLSLMFLGANNPNYGNKLSEEAKKRISNANKNRVVSKETKNKLKESRKGKKHSVESIEKIRQKKLGVPRSEKTKEKLRAAMSGKNNPNYGKPRSEEFKSKVSGVFNYKSKIANIYCNITDSLIAEKVVISQWCKENMQYSAAHLSQTAKADRNKPSCRGNLHHHKNIYARYCNS